MALFAFSTLPLIDIPHLLGPLCRYDLQRAVVGACLARRAVRAGRIFNLSNGCLVVSGLRGYGFLLIGIGKGFIGLEQRACVRVARVVGRVLDRI